MRLQSFFVNIHRRVLFLVLVCLVWPFVKETVELFLVSALTNSAVVTVERKNDEGWVRSRDQLDSNLSCFSALLLLDVFSCLIRFTNWTPGVAWIFDHCITLWLLFSSWEKILFVLLKKNFTLEVRWANGWVYRWLFHNLFLDRQNLLKKLSSKEPTTPTFCTSSVSNANQSLD